MEGHLGPPEAARARKRSPLERAQPVTPRSQASGLQDRQGMNVWCSKPLSNGDLKLICGQQSSKCSGASGGHLEEREGRLSWPGRPPGPPPPGSCWEKSHLSLSPSRMDAAPGRRQAPRHSSLLALPPPAAVCHPLRCLWQQVILIFSIKGAKVLQKSNP